MATFAIGRWGIRQVTIATTGVSVAVVASVAVTIPGVQTDMFVVPIAPATLTLGVVPVGAHVTAANTITVRLYNPTAASISTTSQIWQLAIFAGDQSALVNF